MGLDIFENEGILEKGCVKIEDWGFSVHFGWEFQENSIIYTNTYVLAKILQNCAKFSYAKAGFKNYRNLNNFRQAVESPKSWNLMGFSPKNTFLQLKHKYTEDLSSITFNYLCQNSPTYLCHLWNHKPFFTTQLLCIFLAQTLHTFYKSSPPKFKFSDFPLLRLNFTKFLMHFSNKSQFFFKVWIFFQCHQR